MCGIVPIPQHCCDSLSYSTTHFCVPNDYFQFLAHEVNFRALRVRPVIGNDGSQAKRVFVPMHQYFEIYGKAIRHLARPEVPPGRALSRPRRSADLGKHLREEITTDRRKESV